MSDLKQCPFCGNKNAEYHSGWADGKSLVGTKMEFRSPSITCKDCGIGFSCGSFGWGISDEDAQKRTTEEWNRRA